MHRFTAPYASRPDEGRGRGVGGPGRGEERVPQLGAGRLALRPRVELCQEHARLEEAFVDLGGLEGMIHISELAFHRVKHLSLLHISEPTRLLSISYAVFCLKTKHNNNPTQ